MKWVLKLSVFLKLQQEAKPECLLVVCLQRCAHTLLYIVLSFFLHFFAYQQVEQLLL